MHQITTFLEAQQQRLEGGASYRWAPEPEALGERGGVGVCGGGGCGVDPPRVGHDVPRLGDEVEDAVGRVDLRREAVAQALEVRHRILGTAAAATHTGGGVSRVWEGGGEDAELL